MTLIPPFRIGHGYDAHRFAPGRMLVLGGIRIEHDKGLAGHSDADVLTHAVIDAMLGAMALGDLGRHFPSTDARWKDASSLDLLGRVRTMVEKAGGRVVQVDTILYLERPKVANDIPLMQAELARVLELPIERIAVKATTTDGMGFVGAEEGAAASAVALVAIKTDGES
jgi:2-C-methyl-D-erythritol 2,4-cyclodiphosphate synthase